MNGTDIRQIVEGYYPFGAQHNTDQSVVISPENRYLYNGKELQDELGLNWYDYGNRFYDATIGRFTTQDRFSEKYYTMTPYQYGGNNPINFIDINGDSLYKFNENGDFLGVFDNGRKRIRGQVIKTVTTEVDGEEVSEEVEMFRFKFNDIKHDRALIKSDEFEGLELGFEDQANESLTDQVPEAQGEIQKNGLIKGSWNSGKASGALDFMTKPGLSHYEASKSLFVVDGKAYNNYDAGNFLTGAGFRLVGLPGIISQIGGHLNSIKNSKEDNSANPDYQPRRFPLQFDSSADQRAIRRGASYARRNKRKLKS